MSKLACGCPSANVRTIEKKDTEETTSTESRPSELRQWPTQLHLVPPSAPFLQDAHLLIAADCVPFAYADFHRDYIKGRVLVNACPKLDDTSPYLEKLTAMISQNNILSITVPIMEVPCCRGLGMMVQEAVNQSGKDVPVEIVVIGIDGKRKS